MSKRILIASLLGSLAASGVYAANPDAGKEKSRTCAACHGPDGNSPAGDFPRLAGQHYDYLLKSLRDYKTGKRKNAIMAPQVANLSLRDLEDLAAFYATQQGLTVRKVPYLVHSGNP